MIGLEMERVCFAYPGRTVLDSVTCRFEPGQFHAILGPNGSGKTTLLDLLSGYSQAGTGHVRLNGRAIGDFSKRDLARRVALVSQDYDIRFPFTVEEVVLMGRHPYIDRFSPPSAQDLALAEKVMSLTGIEKLKNSRITEVSGGEKQRSVFARALCQDTPFLLLDEAFANMDIHHSLQLLKLLKSATGQDGKTVIAVLHDLNMAAHWADRILLLHQGTIFAQGPTDTVFTEPNIQRVFNVRSQVAFCPFTQSLQAAFKV